MWSQQLLLFIIINRESWLWDGRIELGVEASRFDRDPRWKTGNFCEGDLIHIDPDQSKALSAQVVEIEPRIAAAKREPRKYPAHEARSPSLRHNQSTRYDGFWYVAHFAKISPHGRKEIGGCEKGVADKSERPGADIRKPTYEDRISNDRLYVRSAFRIVAVQDLRAGRNS